MCKVIVLLTKSTGFSLFFFSFHCSPCILNSLISLFFFFCFVLFLFFLGGGGVTGVALVTILLSPLSCFCLATGLIEVYVTSPAE